MEPAWSAGSITGFVLINPLIAIALFKREKCKESTGYIDADSMKILCVEDDEGLVALLQQVLVKQHYQVEFATDGLTGWHLAEADTYDLILLDWVLPNLSGLEFCQKLRTQGASVLNPNWNTPVLLMTTMDAVTNKVMGLNAGADDYVVKPLVLEELLARIQALLRRNQAIRTPLLQWGDLCLNPNRCEVTYQGQAIALASKEYELLELFLRNPEQIFNLNRLLTALWTAEEIPGEGAVRAHIKGLRHKLKHAGADDPLETIYKLGYRLRPPGEPKAAGATKETVNPPVCEPQAAISSCQIPLEFWEIWETVRSSYCDRLLTIQQAVAHLQTQSLTPEEQQRTAQEAHTLVGSLGSFGLEEASELARQIQQILQQATPLTSRQGELLTPLIAALAQQLGQSEQPEHLESSFQELSGAPSRESSGELAKGAIALLENILHQYTVLLIDDCAEDRLLYSRYLRRSPHVDSVDHKIILR